MATSPKDPTAVVGRRIGAWFVDAIIHLAINFPIFFLMAEKVDPDELYGRADPGFNVSFNDMELTGGKAVLFLVLIGAIWLAHHGWIQGRTGQTVGKRAAAIRVVDAEGAVPGVGRAVGRTLMVVVDAFPYFIPYLTGLVAALSSKGHRRVGDMAAGTWVIESDAAGLAIDGDGQETSRPVTNP